MTSPLISKLNAVRRRHAAVAAGTAGVAAVGLAVLAVAAGMGLDRWLDLPYSARAVLLSADGAGLLALLTSRGLLPVVRGPDVEQAALWVERAVPAFASRLISAVQFLQPAAVPAGASPGMVRALIRQAESVAADVDFAAVVPVRPLTRLGWATTAVVIVAAVAFAYGGRTSVALAERALLVRGVPFPHRTRVTVTSGDVTVARGDPVTLSATAAGDVPAAGRVAVRYGSGTTTDLATVNAADHFDRPIDNVQEPFTYRFAIGDDNSAEYHVRTVVRPAVLGVRCRVTPPSYTGLAAGDRSPWDLSLLAGSRLGLTVAADQPCGGRVHFVGADVDVPLAADVNGPATLHAPDGPVPAGATGFTVELVNGAGVRSRDPVVYRIETTPDQPPTVRLDAPAADVTVTPVAKVGVSLQADDDYGVARLSLRYRITRAGQTVATDDDPNGLTGTYYADPAMAGAGVSRIEQGLDVSWAASPPPAGVATPFAVRWVGSVRPAVSDDYWFSATFTGGVRVSVAGRLLVDRWGESAVAAEGGPVHLQAGRLYPITVAATVAGGQARLSWHGRRVPAQVVPHGCLYRRTSAYEPPADVDGLVGYWPLDDAGDDGFARDAAGPADGTVFDAVRVPGRVGRAIAFDVRPDFGGPNEHVEVPESIAQQYRADESYSLAAWVNLQRTTGRWQGVVTHGQGGGAGYGIEVDPAGHFVAASGGGNLVGPTATPGWHHVTLVQDGPAGRRTLYVDGESAVAGKPQDGSGGGPLVFGNVRDGGRPFAGWVDDVRLYARAVPADKVRALYADPRVAHVPTPPEFGGAAAGAAGTVPVPLAGRPARHVERRLDWDLATLPAPAAVGDTVEVWAEAADGNTVTGPGVGTSEHRKLTVVDEAAKRQELMGRLGDYLGRVRDVSDDQRDLTAKVGSMVGPTTAPDRGKKD